QTFGTENFDVVIVDDGSRDATPQILEAAMAGPLRLRTITQPEGRGAGAARNIGWRATQSPLIAFTDDDCRPDPEWLETLAPALRGHPRPDRPGPHAARSARGRDARPVLQDDRPQRADAALRDLQHPLPARRARARRRLRRELHADRAGRRGHRPRLARGGDR